jgi:hypothetical protein
MDMTPRRSRAYGRVMRALESRSALDRMSSEQRETLRESADTLALARSTDDESVAALAAARSVLVSIRRREAEPWIEQLADDLEDAGPAPIILVAMGTQASDELAATQTQGRARW